MTSTVLIFAKTITLILTILICWQASAFGQSGDKLNNKEEVISAPSAASQTAKPQTVPIDSAGKDEVQLPSAAERQRVIESDGQSEKGQVTPPPAAPLYTPPDAATNKQINELTRQAMQPFEEQRRQMDAQIQRELNEFYRQEAVRREQQQLAAEQFQEQQQAQGRQLIEELERQNKTEPPREVAKLQTNKTELTKWLWVASLAELLICAGLWLISFKTGRAKKSAKAMLAGALIQLPMLICGLLFFQTLLFGVEPFMMSGGSSTQPSNPNVVLGIVTIISLFVGMFGFYLYVGGKIATLINLCLIPNNVWQRFYALVCVSVSYTAICLILARFNSFALLGLVTGAAVLFIGSVIALVKSGKREEDALHGSARFAERQEFKEFEQQLEAGGFVLAPAHPQRIHGKLALPRNLSVMHGLILGGSGTGKSRGYFMANCAEAKNTSLVVTDPKSELWKHTSGFHEKAIRYAPVEPESSYCFNWIPLCADARVAELCARAIMTAGSTKNTDQFWIDAETAFLSAVFSHAATTELPTPVTAYRLFTRQKPEELLEQLENSPSPAAREQAIIFRQTDARIKGAIVPAVAARMQFMRDPNVQVFTSAQTDAPNFGALRRSPAAVYWCLREQDISRLKPLTSLFFTVLLEQIAGEEILENESETPITMMLDEFANIGTIPDFETTISLARGRGVSVWLGVQSLSQLSKAYGQDNAQTIISNCTTKIALHGLDYETAEYVSRMLGEQTISHNRTGFGFGMSGVSVNTGAAQHRRQLLTADEVMRIGETEAIARTSNKYPMRVYKGYYNEPPRTASVTQTLLLIQAADVSAEEVLAV